MKTFFDPENFIEAKCLVTPTHIQPEWYFLPPYAILRAIPKKLGGVIALIGSICILFTLPFIRRDHFRGFCNVWADQIYFIFFVSCIIILGWIGSKPVEDPYRNIGALFTIYYFSFFVYIGLKDLRL